MIDVVKLTFEMFTYYSGASGVPKYINILEYIQKKALRVQLPIPDITLITIIKRLIPQAQ